MVPKSTTLVDPEMTLNGYYQGRSDGGGDIGIYPPKSGQLNFLWGKMTPERLFNSFIHPQKLLYPLKNKFLATPLAIMRSVALHACVSEPTTKICMKIDPYYQRQKCSPGILVSTNISFMQIFAWVRSRGASNESRVVEKGDFRFFRWLYLPNLHI